MAYLFEDTVEGALGRKSANLPAIQILKKTCIDTTQALLTGYRRQGDYSENDEQAKQLARSMGGKEYEKPKEKGGLPDPGHKHALSYVEDWRQLSGQQNDVRELVLAELANAHKLGLDIRKEQVVGKMYFLAAQVHSLIGGYSSPEQELQY